jgi:hypothetical protein
MKNNKIKIGSNRSFGIIFSVVFLIIAIWPLLSTSEIRYWSLVISVIFLILGLIKSKILTPLNKIWFKIGITLGNLISPLVMGIVFFLVLTPTSIIMKILGKDLLNLKKNNNKSYWIEKNKQRTSMKKQF